MIEVFKTDVQEVSRARKLVALLLQHFPGSKINFDLQDCDKILRVEDKQICAEKIIQLINTNGYHCEVLE